MLAERTFHALVSGINIWLVSGLPWEFYSICCLGVYNVMESEMIETAWLSRDSMTLDETKAGGVGA